MLILWPWCVFITSSTPHHVSYLSHHDFQGLGFLCFILSSTGREVIMFFWQPAHPVQTSLYVWALWGLETRFLTHTWILVLLLHGRRTEAFTTSSWHFCESVLKWQFLLFTTTHKVRKYSQRHVRRLYRYLTSSFILHKSRILAKRVIKIQNLRKTLKLKKLITHWTQRKETGKKSKSKMRSIDCN